MRRATLSKAALFADVRYAPHPGQLQVHASTAPRRVLACGVRWGKTRCAAMEALAAALAPRPRSIGWVVAPSYDLADRVFREVVLIALEHLKHRVITLRDHERLLELRNMAGGRSEVRGKSADNPTSLLGEGLDYVIVDEAARLKPLVWQSHLSQRLIDRKGWALLISTPKGKGYFHDLFRRGQGRDPDYASWNHPSWTNPHLDAALIEQERTRLPEVVFRQEYGAEFLEGAGAVFRHVRECATGRFAPPMPGQTYFAGLDLARVSDYTVLVIVNRDCEVVCVDRFTRLDWQLQIGRIRAVLERYRQPIVFVDSTGGGEPIFEALRAENLNVRPYPFTAKSKAALIDHLALRLERREVKLPTPELWPEGIDELEAFEYSITEQGHVRTGSPYGMHDDCVIALALAAWNLQRREVPTFFGGCELIMPSDDW